ncbi:hypothetical protein BBO_05630 [Beauveria brongniartii RCEF 3172]|uniref:Uncharacterized protein n=1 Tax=Beauveria brongniartii RCEF 3172 TaxID=1081107 RepID=A0A167CE06_9HYPO|nr:hypothetical protein BBO_05630 [Beauveria brongniartii RCEF 3172]
MKRLDIRADDTVIVYDTADAGIYSSGSTWPTAIHMAPARFRPQQSPTTTPTTTTTTTPPPSSLLITASPTPQASLALKSSGDLIIPSGSGHRYQILDSRTPDCFSGGSGRNGKIGLQIKG